MKSRLALTLLLTLLLTGCSAQGSGIPTLRIWYSTDDPVERSWSQQLARSFEQSHPGIHVRLTDYSFADLNTKLQLALSAGDPPDLAYVTPRGPGIPAYVAAHRLRDLTAAARTHHWASSLQPLGTSLTPRSRGGGSVLDGLLAAYNRPFSFYGARPGSVVAVPTSLAAVAVLYNRRLLARLHLAVPRSLAAFETALARAKAAGYTPIGLGNGDGWLGDDWYLTLVNALASSSSLQAEQRLSSRFSFRRPPFLQAARILQRWAVRGYFTHDFGGLDAQEGVDLFFQGTTLFQLISSSENSQILQDQQQTGLPIGVFAFPRQGSLTPAWNRLAGRRGGGSVMPLSGYEGWVVPVASKQSQQAIAFIDYLLSPSTARFLLRQGLLPSRALSSDLTVHPVLSGSPGSARPAEEGSGYRIRPWQRQYLHSLATARPGVYLDAAPIANLNATMEANVQLLLQGYEAPEFLVQSLQDVYASRGAKGSAARIDGEF